MISTLKKLGIEPQAIEQPLDMAIPESKIMLAIYLATPEVDNDRRALNMINRMRRAKKEGRFIGVAPKGYAYKITEDGLKYIALYEPEAKIMRWAFEKLAEGGYSQAEMLRIVNKQGLKTSRNNFWSALKNPVYCGKIYVPKNKDEEGYFVQGQHDPFINAIYPRKLVFDDVTYRTPKANPGVSLMSFVNNKLAENKNGKELDYSSLSHQVIPLGFEPRTTTLKV